MRPRLVVDPPPYRPSPLLRGPEQLLLEVAEVRSSGKLVPEVPEVPEVARRYAPATP